MDVNEVKGDVTGVKVHVAGVKVHVAGVNSGEVTLKAIVRTCRLCKETGV
jgi:hypothetical protein